MKSRLTRIYFICILLSCGLLSPHQGSAAEEPSQLELVWEAKIPEAFPHAIWAITDPHGDGNEEIVLALDNHTLQTRAFAGGAWRVLSQVNLLYPGRFNTHTMICPCGDLDGDGLVDLAVNQSHDDTTWIAIIGTHNPVRFPYHYIPDSNGDGVRDSRVCPIRVIDIQESGDTGLITSYASGKDMHYRGVVVYSLQTGQELWRFDTGSNPYPRSFRFCNLDGEPGDEILFTTPSPNNGFETELTDDKHAWIVVLTDTGDLLWLRKLGGYFCNPVWAEILDLPGEPSYVVTCARNNRTDDEDCSQVLPDSIRVWNGRSGELIQTIVESSSVNYLVRLDNQRIAVGHVDGVVSVLEVKTGGVLFEAKRKQFATRTKIQGVVDFDSDGVSEIVCFNNNPELHVFILNEHLDILTRRDFNDYAGLLETATLHRANEPTLFIATTTNFRSTFIVRLLPWWKTKNAIIAELGVGALLLGLILVFLVRRWRKSTPHAQVLSPLSPTGDMKHLRKALLTASEVTSHGRLAATSVVERITWLLEAISSQPQATPESLSRLESAVRDFHDVTIPQIKNILALCSALQIEPSVIQDVTTDIAEFKTHLDKSRNLNWSPSSVCQSLPKIRRNTERLVSGMKKIRSVAKQYVNLPLKPEIERACAAIADPAESLQTVIDIRMEPGIDKTFVRASRDDLVFILENLLSNSLRAVEHTKLKRIIISASLNGKYACIEVSDTGSGIPPEDVERIFHFGVSNKDSGGTGLFASRRLLEDLGGELRLKESRPGVGTTMELRLLIESVGSPVSTG